MKKLFGIVAIAASILMTCVFTGCAQEYTGNYYNTEYVAGITPEEYESNFYNKYYSEVDTFRSTWNLSSTYVKKEHITYTELYNYIDSLANWKNGAKGVINDCDENGRYYTSINCNDGKSYNLLYIEIVK